MTRLNRLDWAALVVLIIGGLNWGLVGLFSFDLVAAIFGPMSALSRIIYILVGASAVWIAIDRFRWGGRSAETVHRAR